MGTYQHIVQLDPQVAQRIAAGEVIDRPQAVLRELLDNAIDAEASSIDVYITDGGIGEVKVIDNGRGMSREDLLLCCKPHATSKIRTVEDLYTISTMGFRGEALASMAACARLSITSALEDGLSYTISTDSGFFADPVIGAHPKGTMAVARDLFYSIPGRRNFLGSPRSEAAACKRVFLEKAAAFPNVNFKYINNGKLQLHLPSCSPTERIIAITPTRVDPVLFFSLEEKAGDFSLRVIAGLPELYRSDRSRIAVYVNDRRIDDYALVQAVTYAYSQFLPGGCYPYCTLFIDVDPQLVDVNIHPAKREVKLRNGREIHHQISVSISSYLRRRYSNTREGDTQSTQPLIDLGLEEGRQQERSPHIRYESFTREREYPLKKEIPAAHGAQQVASPPAQKIDRQWLQKARSQFEQLESGQESKPVQQFFYHGQIFGVFLLVEREKEFFFIDQHAAHERVIFERLTDSKAIQPLLIPIEFETGLLQDEYLSAHLETFQTNGIGIVRVGDRRWELSSLPSAAMKLTDLILQAITDSSDPPQKLIDSLFATISCRLAVKEHDVLDRSKAIWLIEQTFALAHPACPHGRPVYKRVTETELYKAVGRII